MLRRGGADVVGDGALCCPGIYCSIIRGQASGGGREGKLSSVSQREIPLPFAVSSPWEKPSRPWLEKLKSASTRHDRQTYYRTCIVGLNYYLYQ